MNVLQMAQACVLFCMTTTLCIHAARSFAKIFEDIFANVLA